MELTQLIQFQAIAKYESITKAAEQLHISQPGLSAMLKKLEDELGTKLFYRSRSHMELTPTGQLVLDHVNIITAEVNQMKKDVSALQRQENEISALFCCRSVMWYFTPLFSHAFPDMRLDGQMFQEGGPEDISLLTQEKADLLITSRPLASSGIESIPFLTDNHLLSVPRKAFPVLAKKKVLTEKDVSLISEIHYLDQDIDSFCQKFKNFMRQSHPEIAIKIYHDYFIYIQSIQSQDTITISTELAQHFRNDGDNRILIPFDIPELKIRFYLNYLKVNRRRLEPVLKWEQYAK